MIVLVHKFIYYYTLTCVTKIKSLHLRDGIDSLYFARKKYEPEEPIILQGLLKQFHISKNLVFSLD